MLGEVCITERVGPRCGASVELEFAVGEKPRALMSCERYGVVTHRQSRRGWDAPADQGNAHVL